jgi:hypothetical protein
MSAEESIEAGGFEELSVGGESEESCSEDSGAAK